MNAGGRERMKTANVLRESWMETIMAWADRNGVDEIFVPRSAEALLDAESLNLFCPGLRDYPEGFGNLTRLTSLDMSANLLPAVPGWISRLTQLKHLSLRHNDLQILPEWIGELGKLRTLDAGRNKLSDLPESLCRLQNLEWLAVNRNPLRNGQPVIERLCARGCTVFMCGSGSVIRNIRERKEC